MLRKDLRSLKRYLLRHGGGSRFQIDSYVEQEIDEQFCTALLAMGAFFPGSGARVFKGAVSRCHENAAKLAKSNKSYRCFTGFALSRDRIWRVHSWIAAPRGIIETTNARVLYFGIPVPDRCPKSVLNAASRCVKTTVSHR